MIITSEVSGKLPLKNSNDNVYDFHSLSDTIYGISEILDYTNIEMKEIIVPDEYKNKISFRDDLEKYVFKCGKICIANIMFNLSEDITFPTNNSWNTFLSLPFELCVGNILYFFPNIKD